MSGLIREYEVNGDNYDEEKERYSLWKEKDAGCFVHYIAGHRAGLRFCRCYLQKRSILSGPDELYQGTERRILVWNRYAGKRYFFLHLARRTGLSADRCGINGAFYRDCHCLWCDQWNCRRKSGYVANAFYGDYFKHPESAADYFPAGHYGKGNNRLDIIGLTSWFGIAKIIRTEVRQLRSSEYVIAAKCMGGSFWHILWKHLAPNFVSSIMFMVVMNVRSAIVAESTLSFLGIGLPLDVISWGSMLSLAEKALMSRAWWIVLIPGIFLVVVLMCITSLGHWLQVRVSHQEAKL